ncbi:MAG: hypothetical protein HDR12_17120 [Lachnospiraceae bacterium]|nr:hypothetical protein [Lachnospiraceae bacterium]
MKKLMSVKLWLTICFVLGMMMMPNNQLKAEAADIIATVHGTVSSKTTNDLLYLSTPEGMMNIKLDSNTEVTGIKLLLPNSSVYVAVTYGNDGYLHAAKLYKEEPKQAVTIDTAHPVTVSGTISSKSTDEMLYFNTSGGEMHIKLDDTTKINGGVIILVNKTYNITCARGSDAQMHAISIDYPNSNTAITSNITSSTGNSPMPAAAVTAQTTVVTGTVGNNTTENMLYLATSGGEMNIVIDANTDSRFGMILTPGRSLTLSVYRGSDAYMHAAMIVGTKTASSAVQVDTAAPMTVTGTVSSKSTEDIMYLNTPQGEMLLKLDAVYNVSNCKVLISGKQVTVTCARGSDAYLHALTIKGN